MQKHANEQIKDKGGGSNKRSWRVAGRAGWFQQKAGGLAANGLHSAYVSHLDLPDLFAV